MITDLSKYDNRGYNPGRGFLYRSLWFFINALFFINPFNPSSFIKIILLRLFGAKIGSSVVIKPGVNIKYPWNLSIGDYTWIGERVWIDSLDRVRIGKHCCLSQGAALICGNHDYTSQHFDLRTAPIVLEDGVWIGSHAIVTLGVMCCSHSVLSVHSVASSNLDSYSVYRGNPAAKVRLRHLK